MVTLRDIVEDLARISVTLLSWVYALIMGLFLVLRFVVGDRFWLIGGVSNFTFYCFLPLIPLILLAIPARAKWGLITTIPIFLVGVLMFGSYFLPKYPNAPVGATLKIVTFNVYNSNQSLTEMVTWLRETKADFVVMQELPERQVRAFLFSMSDLYPYQSSRSTQDAAWSNLLLSRYPILSHEDLHEVSASHMQQRYAVSYNNQPIAIYNVDVAIPAGTPRIPIFDGFLAQLTLGYQDGARNTELYNLIERWQQETVPFIVAGDFAMTDQNGIYRDISRIMGDSFREVGTGLGGSWPVGEIENVMPRFIPPLLRVDYIWHSSQFRPIEARLGSKIGSDHLPLYAIFEFMYQ